jgi:arylsulfatase A-like enzyme
MGGVARARAHRLHAIVGLLLAAVASGCERIPAAPRSSALVTSRADLNPAVVGNETRPILKGKTHRFVVQVPPHAELDVGYAIREPGDLERVTFTIAAERDGRRHMLMERRFDQPRDAASVWHDVTLNLDALAGQEVMLILDAEVQPPRLFEWRAVWTNPRVRVASSQPATNIILISIDTLRADHLGCYGSRRPTSPNVDRMAREGILWRDFFASSCWTLPSHASMLTGLDPARHGAVRFGIKPLPADVDTLAELLWDRGYETGAFVGGGFVSSKLRFDQGFDRFWECAASKGETDTLQWVVDLAEPWMEQRRAVPFFLFLHTFQVHIPYAPPPPYDTLFDPLYPGRFKTLYTQDDARYLSPKERNYARVVEHLSALYDGEIRAMDVAVGDLLDFLVASGLARNTCVFLTSDHGEEFNEHGDLHHSNAKLYEELIHIPFIAWCPSRWRGGRIASGLASHTDIVPTMLDLAGGAARDRLDGASLLPVLDGNGVSQRDVAISEVDGSAERTEGTVRSLRDARYKLITSSINGSQLLFDLTNDAAELRDLAGSNDDIARRLTAAADRRRQPPVVAAPPPAAPPAVVADDALRERLRALGYVE